MLCCDARTGWTRGREDPPTQRNPRRLDATQDVQQQVHKHPLGGVMVEAAVARAAPVFFLAPAGQRHQHRALLAWFGAQAARHFEAVHAGHAQVEQDGVRGEAPRRFQPGRAVPGGVHLGAGGLEQHGQRLGGVVVVVHHQHAPAFQRRFAAIGLLVGTNRLRQNEAACQQGSARNPVAETATHPFNPHSVPCFRASVGWGMQIASACLIVQAPMFPFKRKT
jgi:hypothetical protein